jgi:hypothetical protein
MTIFIIVLCGVVGFAVAYSWVERYEIKANQEKIEKDLEELKLLIVEQKKKDKQLTDKRVLEAEI